MKPENRLQEAAKQISIALDELNDDSDVTWIRQVQRDTQEWRLDTIGEDITPMSQAAHTSVEASEILDLLVKGETYSSEDGPVGGWESDEARQEVMKECGDVIVAHLGTMSLLGLDVQECIEAALAKNGARDWQSWQEEA